MSSTCQVSDGSTHMGDVFHVIKPRTVDGAPEKSLFHLCALHRLEVETGVIPEPTTWGSNPPETPDQDIIEAPGHHAGPYVPQVAPVALPFLVKFVAPLEPDGSKPQLGEYQSVKAALDSIIAGPAVVWVSPGTYTEAPMTAKTDVSIVPLGAPESVIIQAQDPTQDLLTIPLNVENFYLGAVALKGPLNAGKFLVVNQSGKRKTVLRGTSLRGADGGLLTRGAGSFTVAYDVRASDAVNYPFQVDAGADTEMRLFDPDIRPTALAQVGLRANGGRLIVIGGHCQGATVGGRAEAGGTLKTFSTHLEQCVTALHSTGSGSRVDDDSSFIEAGGAAVVDGVLVNNSAVGVVANTKFVGYTNGIHMGSTGSNEVQAVGVFLRDSTTWDILSDAATSNTLVVAATTIDPAKISVDFASFHITDLLSPRPPLLGTPEPALYNAQSSLSTNTVRYTLLQNVVFAKVTGLRFLRTSGSANVKVGLYRDDTGAKVAESASTLVNSGTVTTVSFSSGILLVPGIYWLAIISDGPFSCQKIITDTGWQDAQNETPGSFTLPTSKTGTASTDKFLMLLETTS